MPVKTDQSLNVAKKLRAAGLRPTEQRLALCQLLFGQHDRHVSADSLHAEAVARGLHVSLATVYNNLNQFTQAGLLREIGLEGERSYFDTNTSDHYHMLDEASGKLMDIDPASVSFNKLLEIPEDREISRIDVVVRLRHKGSA